MLSLLLPCFKTKGVKLIKVKNSCSNISYSWFKMKLVHFRFKSYNNLFIPFYLITGQITGDIFVEYGKRIPTPSIRLWASELYIYICKPHTQNRENCQKKNRENEKNPLLYKRGFLPHCTSSICNPHTQLFSLHTPYLHTAMIYLNLLFIEIHLFWFFTYKFVLEK